MPSYTRAKLTLKAFERMQPGEVLRDVAIGGFFAERGKRRVSLKVQADLPDGRTVKMTIGALPGIVSRLAPGESDGVPEAVAVQRGADLAAHGPDHPRFTRCARTQSSRSFRRYLTSALRPRPSFTNGGPFPLR